MKSIKISNTDWLNLRSELLKQYPRSVCLINHKMKEVLGFTLRSCGFFSDGYFLDFYDERKRNWFVLRFSDYVKD